MKAKETTWPMEELKERRNEQNVTNDKIARAITQGLAHSEEEMPMVGITEFKCIYIFNDLQKVKKKLYYCSNSVQIDPN